MVAGVEVQHQGTFNMGETTDQWKPFTSDQKVVTQRPGFDWTGRIAMMPGVLVRVHDAYVAGEGILHGSLLGLFSLVELLTTSPRSSVTWSIASATLSPDDTVNRSRVIACATGTSKPLPWGKTSHCVATTRGLQVFEHFDELHDETVIKKVETNKEYDDFSQEKPTITTLLFNQASDTPGK